MAKQLNVNLAFTADTSQAKAQLQSLQTQLSGLLNSTNGKSFGNQITRDINKAVKNNPRKFPKGYILELTPEEKIQLVENFHRFNSLKHSTSLPNAFTEKGLYMLATI